MAENKHTMQELYQWQALPLNIKVLMTAERVRNWVNEFDEDGVYLSFSAGKDSTVLGHIIREVCGYKNIPFVFVDVPTQYPELKQFAQRFDNLVILKPKISFAEVCEKYGFPLISKEVSECVQGARRYLTSLQQQNTILKQHINNFYERVTETGEYSKFSNALSNAELVEQEHLKAIRGGNDTNINMKSHTSLEQIDSQSMIQMTRGGGDNKYRKLRGIGEYDTQDSFNARNVDKGQSEKGEYP